MSQRPRSRPPGADASSLSVSPRGWLGRSRRLVLAGLLVALFGLVLGLGGVAPTAAHAAPTDIVSIPDANLKLGLNNKISPTRPATQDITYAEAAAVTGSVYVNDGPVTDLTGLEAFTNVTDMNLNAVDDTANTFTNLQPLAAMTKLTSLGIQSSQATDLSPLATLSNLTFLMLDYSPVTDARALQPLSKLTTLWLDGDKISDAAKLPALPGLTSLSLVDNVIVDLSRLPSMPNVTNLSLNGNRIVDVAPLLSKIDTTKLSKLGLFSNRINDVSPLAALATAKLGQTANGLKLDSNRITDLSPLSGFTKPITYAQTATQQLYVGPYQDGGIVLPELKDSAEVAAQNDSLQIAPALGNYDLTTHRVTLTDPTTPSVSITAKVTNSTTRQSRWVVNFTAPPVAPGEDTGTKLLVSSWDKPNEGQLEPVDGPVRLTQRLQILKPGDVFDGTTCPSFSYHWMRDGQEITGTPYSAVDASPLVIAPLGVNKGIASYQVSPQDVGHLLSVRVTCDSTGISAQSAQWPAVGEAPDLPFVGDTASVTTFSHVPDSAAAEYTLPGRSGVIGDPDNVAIPVIVGQTGADGALADPSQLTLRFVSAQGLGGTPAVTADQVMITGTGAERQIAITPTAVTFSNLTFELTGTTGQKTNVHLSYMASAATTPTSHVLLGMSDASTAIGVGDGYMIVGDDEKRDFRLYDATKSGREAANFVNPVAGPGETEMDTEASARKGNTIWWFGSNAKDKDGEPQPSRSAIVKSTLTGSGANAKLTIDPSSNFYNLKSDLVSWDGAHGNRFGFTLAATKSGPRPTDLGGLNLEGAEFSRDGSELYLAFRAPISPATVGGKALLVPITNLEELTTNPSTAHAQFGEPILFDLGGDSIREIRKNDAGEYLILSAPAGSPTYVDPPPTQTLWAWNGDPQDAPRKLTTVLPKDSETAWRDNAGAWEGIGEMPARLTPGAKVRLLMDQGEDQLYGDGSANKKDTNSWTNKARTDVVTLAGPAGTVAGLAAPGAFPAQAANTIGSPKTVTVTNTGSNVLHVGAVSTTDQDQVSADEFLISGNTCSGKTLGLDQSCSVRVRFAPSRQSATSTATLVVESDVVSGSDSIALSGTSTTLPKGDPGEDGQNGALGTPGQDGQDGAPGSKGDTGAQGGNGHDGAPGGKGDTGAQGGNGQDGAGGPLGPLGPLGPVGPQGPGGPAGKDGTFAFSAKRSSVKVRRGHTVSLSFSVTNGTKALVRGATAKANAPKRLRISGRSSATVASLKAGQSRTVTVHLKVDSTTKAGSYKVPVKLTVAGRSVTRTVTVQVSR